MTVSSSRFCDGSSSSEVLAFAGGLGAAEIFYGAGALDGDRDETADGFERLAADFAAGDGDGANGTHSHAKRNVAHAAFGLDDGLAAGGGRPQVFGGEFARGSGAIDIRATDDEDCGRVAGERLHDVLWERVEQADDVFGNE